MEFLVSFRFLFSIAIFTMLMTSSIGQLSPAETRILFQVQKLLEYPEVLQGWNNWTNFCYLPPSNSLNIVCSNNRVTELTVIGNKSSPSQRKSSVYQKTLSKQFSIDAFFTALTKLSNLKVLSLVSLGLWGPLPAKINRFWSLEVLNISSNFIYGEIPPSIASIKNLTSLVLADNMLNGSAPDLKNLLFLEELNLGDNHFGPKFPVLENNLVSIILKNNSLRSEIPVELKNFYQLQQFDVSTNKIVGPIPSFLFSLPAIQYLNLAGNQLSSAIPTNISCSINLKFLDISHNLLIGKLPACIGSDSPNRTVISSWNCLSGGGNSNYQHPYTFCHKEALAVKPPVNGTKQESRVSLGLVLGIIGGTVGIAVVLGLLILVAVRRAAARRDEEEDHRGDRSVAEKISVRSSPKPAATDARRVPQMMRLATIGLPPYYVFTLEEIEDATNNFDPSNLMGEGSQGQIYKGWLRDGSVVQVKCVKLKQKQMHQSLMQHMEVISKLRHRHLVSLLGHCTVTYQDHSTTASTVFMVLEHLSNGSLRDYLSERKKEMLKWPQRMAISIGVARGVQFLHTGVAPGIFGNDLKIDNILLDDVLTPKISGYNIPFPSKMGSESPLTGEDLSNRFESGGDAEKDDIYQLGVILLQIITGNVIKSASELEDQKLQLQRTLTSTQKLRAATDSAICGTYAYESLRTAVEITVNCLCKESSKRPSIEDVLWNLQYSIQVQEGWTSSGNLSSHMQ